MPAGKALAVVLVALLLGGLLNVRSLTEAAERQPPGFGRSLALVAVRPFQWVSGAVGLDQPRDLLAERLGRDVDAGVAGAAATGASSAGGTAAAGDGPADVVTDALRADAALDGRLPQGEVDPAIADVVAVPAGVDPDAVAVAAQELPRRLRGPFTAEDELRIAVIGDSLTEQLGPALADVADRPGVHATTTHHFTYSSGLTRPDFYDWPARAAQLAEEEDPDLWVVVLGANDAQDVRDDGGRFRHLGSDEWESIYAGRVGALMDQLVRGGRGVIWIGQPVMRDGAFDERMAYVNGLYERAAAARPEVTYLDARRIFADRDGGYADYLPGADGRLVEVRQGDGIHLTRAGAARLAAAVAPLLPLDTAPPAAQPSNGVGSPSPSTE
jgi:uncharacterized protein